jgi:hypothetical protein
MALSPLRKWLNTGFGVVMLVSVAALLWPLISRPFELRTFCAALQPGTSDKTVRTLAEPNGFSVSAQNNGVVHVYDHQSLGKFSCTLRMQGNVLTASSFGFTE